MDDTPLNLMTFDVPEPKSYTVAEQDEHAIIAGHCETCDRYLGRAYVVCNRLLDPETNEHCEFDGDVVLDHDRAWRCPGCGRTRRERRS